MSFQMGFFLVFIAVTIASYCGVTMWYKLAHKKGLFDNPSERKVHETPIATMGGVVIFIIYWLGILFLTLAFRLVVREQIPLFLASLVVFLTGIIDDIYDISPKQKSLGIIAGATIVYWLTDFKIYNIFEQLFGMGWHSDWLGYIVTVIWIFYITNAFNLIDGLDGLSSGVSIIDEEHETTYKQMDTVRYHAREVALWRGKYHHAPVVLGSATPSLESRARAQKGVYTLLQMKKRANQQLLPTVHIVDMTKEKKNSQLTIFSEPLKNAIADRLAKKEQMVLFLNRRGYSSFVMCRDCGHVIQCPNCDISLTLHMDTKQMKCHYCGHEENIPQTCPKCLGQAIRYFGMGTQKVEEELLHLFPQARVIRMDVDTTRRKGDHKKLLTAFGNQEADILLGTQMIAKGLDFPNITLVGIINADTSLNLPDFRATEKTYQLLTQVAGRAGRGDLSGEVFVQTYNPEHYVIQLSKEQNYEQFYLHEMRMRHLGKYSPYFYTTSITVTHTHEATALKTAYDVKQIIQQYMGSAVHILGPSTYSIARMQNKYYFQIILKYKNQQFIDKALQEVMQFGQTLAKKNIYLSIDVEPLHFI